VSGCAAIADKRARLSGDQSGSKKMALASVPRSRKHKAIRQDYLVEREYRLTRRCETSSDDDAIAVSNDPPRGLTIVWPAIDRWCIRVARPPLFASKTSQVLPSICSFRTNT
jgi:hypothetical protein